MCGIAGVFSLQTDFNNRFEDITNSVLDAQHARGPDHRATVSLQRPTHKCVLGHNRLAIIDLSYHANQPMLDHNENYALVFNGVIYNYVELRAELTTLGYQWHSESDTEVILHAFAEWGMDCVSRFNGMFAFVIYDKCAQQLWLARDRFGVKPLYYYVNGNALYFASSSHVLAKHFKLKTNNNYISRGIHYWLYDDASDITAYEGLQQLPASHVVCIDATSNSQLRYDKKRYYQLSSEIERTQPQIIKHNDHLAKLTREHIERSVNLRLRADVPIGISLSGGLDSALIAAIAAKQHPNIIGFCFGHPDDKNSEGPIVAKLAKQLNIEVQYIQPTQQELIKAFWQCLDAQDAPFASCSVVAQYLVYEAAKRAGIKVILGGQGGDEAFLGYRKFMLFYLKQLLQQRKYVSAANFIISTLPMLYHEVSMLPTYWQTRKRYLKAGKIPSILNFSDTQALAITLQNNLSARQQADITDFSLPTLLRYEDRNSMAHSIESRLPFLDYELLEFACALPVTAKLKHGYGKWILREAAQGLIPDEIRLARYKRGFDVPNAAWINAGLGNEIRDLFLKHHSSINHLLPPNADITTLFSDELLSSNKVRMCEAITLCYQSSKNSFPQSVILEDHQES